MNCDEVMEENLKLNVLPKYWVELAKNHFQTNAWTDIQVS